MTPFIQRLTDDLERRPQEQTRHQGGDEKVGPRGAGPPDPARGEHNGDVADGANGRF